MQTGGIALGSTSAPRLWGKRHTLLAIICFINFSIWLDEGVFGILTPYWATSLHLTPVQIGTGSAAYLLGDFPLLFVGGMLADRFGPRLMLLICVFGCAILSASMLLVHNYEALFIRNALFGIFFGFLWPSCNRILATWLPAHERTRFTALWYSSMMFAFVVGPLLGLSLAQHARWEDGFLVVAVLGVPAFLLLLFAVKDHPKQVASISAYELQVIYTGLDHTKVDESFSWLGLAKLFTRRSVLAMIAATMVSTTPAWLLNSWGVYQLIHISHVNPQIVSYLVAISYLVIVIYGFFHGWVFKHIFKGRCRPALVCGSILSGIGFFIAAYTSSPYVFVFTAFVVGNLCGAFYWSTLNAYWANLVEPKYVGTMSGISGSAQVIGGFILVNQSGHWVEPSLGIHALSKIFIVGGLVFFSTIIPIFIAKAIKIHFADHTKPTISKTA